MNFGNLTVRNRLTLASFCFVALGVGAAIAVEPESAPLPAPKTGEAVVASGVGDPLAAGKIELIETEMANGIRQRGIESTFMRFRNYFGNRLDVSRAAYTGSELTGNCRLSWYDRIMRNPLKAPSEGERFTREMHQAVLAGETGLTKVLQIARAKLDLPDRPAKIVPKAESPQQALEIVKQALTNAKVAHAASLAPLTKSEIRELNRYLTTTMVQSTVGHTVPDRSTARRMCDLLEKMDRDAMFSAAEELSVLISKDLWRQFAKLPAEKCEPMLGVTGTIHRRIDTPAGTIVVGGTGKNVYQLDQMDDVVAVIDLGGDDEYVEGAATLSRPLLVTVDLEGNDYYHGSRPGIQGSGILGIGMLLDWAGNDTYVAQDVAQGSCLGGIGILIDAGGNDHYKGLRRVQGHALAGLGILIDRGGADDYRAAMWAQGFGAPLGFGLLDDLTGNDHYFVGGQWLDSYPETPGYEGWGQGVGAGLRQVANGGIGILLDGQGDDVYEFDYMGHGGGYWCGLGFFRDFSGNDQHLGSTNTSYGGGTRGQPVFQRFGNGWGCHYAAGFCFDDSGDDVYRGSIMNQGFGWDCGIGVLCDFGGNDKYTATGSTCTGAGAQGSLGILFDYDGDDEYTSYGQGYATSSINYHPISSCGGNFSFLIDYGGTDQYSCGVENNSYNQRGAAGGFLIDRPNQSESAQNREKSTPRTKTVSASSGDDQ